MKFIRGASMAECPQLMLAACRLKFVMMPERSVERLHAMGKSNTLKAPNHSEDYFSIMAWSLIFFAPNERC